MKTNSEYTKFNTTTRCSTVIFNSFKLNRCLYVLTFPYLTKNRHLNARGFAANKRIPIYENNVFVDTKPYTLKNGVIIDDGL